MRTKIQFTFLFGCITALTLAAILGITAVIIGRFDAFWGRVFTTSLSIGAACLLGLIGMLGREHAKASPAGTLCIPVSLVSLVLFFVQTWAEIRQLWYLKTLACFWMASAFLALAALVGIALLSRGWFEWARIATWSAMAALYCLGVLEIWLETREEILLKAINILSILVAFGSIAVLVLDRVSRIAEAQELQQSLAGGVEMVCPRCTTRQTITFGKTQCRECGLVFIFRVRERE